MPSYDLGALKAAFGTVEPLSVTRSAITAAAALSSWSQGNHVSNARASIRAMIGKRFGYRNNLENSKMYQKIDVWKRTGSGSVVRFQCVKRIADEYFAVQNADFFRLPLSNETLASSGLRFVELLLDEDPLNRCPVWHGSLTEAITEHERSFEDMPGTN